MDARGRRIDLLVQAGEDRTRGLSVGAVRERMLEAAREERALALKRHAARASQYGRRAGR